MRNTLHGDGTTKYHRHYQNFQINTAEGVPLSIGLIEIVDQNAETILSVWKERILEIAQAVSNQKVVTENVTETVNKLFCSVKNTISDQCATNGVFNKLLEDLRKEVLPKVLSNWKCLSSEDQSSLEEMGNLFCKVHH